MIKNPAYKPFNLEHAKAGAPVGRGTGENSRIVCFDAKGKYPLVVLTYYPESGVEIVNFYNEAGISSDYKLPPLGMKPMFRVEDRNVFYGDVLILSKTPYHGKGIISHDPRYFTAGHNVSAAEAHLFTWPKAAVTLYGKDISKDSLLWCKIWNAWGQVKAGDRVQTGLSADKVTHLDRLENPCNHENYRWEKPVFLKGLEICPEHALWYNISPDKHPRDWKLVNPNDPHTFQGISHKEYIDKFADSQCYRWEKPKILQTLQQYQAIKRSERGSEYLDSTQYGSESACWDYYHRSKHLPSEHEVIRVIPTILVEISEK